MSSGERWHLFAGYDYYPVGGWDDYIGTYESVKDAQVVVTALANTKSDERFPFGITWAHAICLPMKRVDAHDGNKMRLTPTELEQP